MKALVEYFAARKKIFKSLQTVAPKELGSRKRVKIYFGVDTKQYYNAIIAVQKSSRILQKEVMELEELVERLQRVKEVVIKKRYLYLQAPICSKARAKLEALDWVVYDIS